MKDYFDVKFSELLQKSEFELPNSYEMRFQNTLEKISAKKAKRYFLLFHSKVAAVIALCVVSLSLSIGAGAAINLYIQRMNSLNEEELQSWEQEHLKLLSEIAPEEFDIKHYAALVELKARK